MSLLDEASSMRSIFSSYRFTLSMQGGADKGKILVKFDIYFIRLYSSLHVTKR